MSISRRMTSSSLSNSSGGKAGVLHDVAKNVDGDGGAGVGNVDMINGAVKGGVGVHVAARRLDFLVDAAAGAGGGAFEEHVFQNVGQAGAQPFALRNAAGVAPGLRRNDRRAVVFAHNDDQAVFQRHQPDVGRNAWNLFFRLGPGRRALAGGWADGPVL